MQCPPHLLHQPLGPRAGSSALDQFQPESSPLWCAAAPLITWVPREQRDDTEKDGRGLRMSRWHKIKVRHETLILQAATASTALLLLPLKSGSCSDSCHSSWWNVCRRVERGWGKPANANLRRSEKILTLNLLKYLLPSVFTQSVWRKFTRAENGITNKGLDQFILENLLN